MRYFLTILFITFLSIDLSTAQNSFANYPLPSNPDTLRILAIGNSFSDDGTEYLPGLLEAAGIHNVVLARLYIGGCSLERHCKEYAEGLDEYIYYKSTRNHWETVSKRATLLDGLKDEPWDIITIQETSGRTGLYETYEEWIPRLVDIIRKEALNPHATIAWHETWAYASNSDHGMFKLYGNNQEKMYNGIVSCVRIPSEEFGLPVIPSGDAIQIARGTRLNNDKVVPATSKVYQLTRDGYHLTRQFGRYIAACTWFEALIKPTLGKSVKGNGYLLRDTEYSMTRRDARLCQKCAAKAMKAW
ncbi:MAG TPA: DUF4886 domain-containing protein [Rikenellaceae bacterium]|nr:DUF4886 domain-containing protein [Rikenellaceae bacterium]